MGYSVTFSIGKNLGPFCHHVKQTLQEVDTRTQKYFATSARGAMSNPGEIPEMFRKAFGE